MLAEAITSVPPRIAEIGYAIPSDLIGLNERALIALGAMDGESTGQPAAMARFMIRSESVASSKIERVSASTADFARALAGQKSNSSAVSMVAASAAPSTMVAAAGSRGASTSRAGGTRTTRASRSSLPHSTSHRGQPPCPSPRRSTPS